MRPEEGTLISRAQAITALLEILTDQPVVICNGFPSREVHKIADRPTHFYMIGSMGNAAAIALGVALAKPNKQVVTFDGDGNVLMGMGTLSNVVPLDKVAKSAGYVNVERVLDRDDLVYEFKDMLKKDGPSFLLIKVNEFVEDAGRVVHDPTVITQRFMKAIEG
jgi:thiamine pyrophosphate-dependent acetolactate synthase large subunit-like protein